jgi:hypothetical protein
MIQYECHFCLNISKTVKTYKKSIVHEMCVRNIFQPDRYITSYDRDARTETGLRVVSVIFVRF